MPAPLINAGSFACDGSPRFVDVGFEPDVIYASMFNGESNAIWAYWSKTSWVQRTQQMRGADSFAGGIAGVHPTGKFMLAENTLLNAAGGTLHWLALADNGSGALNNTGWMGTDQTPYTVIVGNGQTTAPFEVTIKRDNNEEPAYRAAGMTRTVLLESAAPSAVGVTSINGDGTITLGTLSAVNQLSGAAIGEATDCLAIWDSAWTKLVSYVGDGTSNRTINGFPSGSVAIKVVADAQGTRAGFVTSTMPAGRSASAQLAAPRNGAILGIVGGQLALGDATYNATGVTYYATAFAASSDVQNRPAKVFAGETYGVLLRGSNTSNINCGVDDSLSMTGPYSLEWWGDLSVRNAASLHYLMARSATDEGRADSDGLANGAGTRRDGKWSWGLLATRVADIADWGGPQFVVVTTNYNNITDNSGSENDIRTKPWRTGILVPREPFHALVTTNGQGRWRLYLNGKLVKQRKIDMAQVSRSDDAGTRVNAGPGTGLRTVLGARQGDSAIGNLSRQKLLGAGVYGAELTPAHVLQLYRRNFLGDTSQLDITPVERWLPINANAAGTSIAASINAANNGVITTGARVPRDQF